MCGRFRLTRRRLMEIQGYYGIDDVKDLDIIALGSLFRGATNVHQNHNERHQDGDPDRDSTNRSSRSHIDPPCASIRTHCLVQ
jgi:hypothetical protein